MLSKEELSRYGTATLTSVFLDRVFQECLTYDGEMVRSHAGPVGDLPLRSPSSFLLMILKRLYVNVQLQTN